MLNAGAMVFSLAHYVMDWHIGLFGESSSSITALQASLMWLVTIIYAWWSLSLARASRGEKSHIVTLAIFAVGWTFAGNGLPIFACPPPCAGVFPHQDITHVGSLIFGGLASYETLRVSKVLKGRIAWSYPLLALVLVAFVFALEAFLAPL